MTQKLVTQKQAHDLAVRYAAYLEAITADKPDHNRICVWAKMLLRSQRAVWYGSRGPQHLLGTARP